MSAARFGPGAARLGGLLGRALGWSAEQFWSATPMEVAAAVGGEREGDPPVDLAALMRRFPDG